jgi:prophage regulatory protein
MRFPAHVGGAWSISLITKAGTVKSLCGRGVPRSISTSGRIRLVLNQHQLHPKTMATQDFRFLRLPQVMKMTGLSRSTLYLRVRQGRFPAPVKLGERAIAWPSPAVEAWISEQMSSGRAA